MIKTSKSKHNQQEGCHTTCETHPSVIQQTIHAAWAAWEGALHPYEDPLRTVAELERIWANIWG